MQLAIGTVGWVSGVPSRIDPMQVFPLSVRSSATALATITNFGANFAVSLVLPTIEGSVGLPATFASFAAIGVLSLVSIYLTVPETKGKSLEEIEKSMMS